MLYSFIVAKLLLILLMLKDRTNIIALVMVANIFNFFVINNLQFNL